ncbi:hypothetical protein CEY16_11450 [Halalkalibacillus sediminis]|uniref:Uncharacterized protein n=1 Tax=Halalkalibacillus sediminis TaxID=2018042 RepID=A0A2I0QSM6_9BACI|nr:hypothetical protein [Halalkalibacillus sediminis]PKR77341.1 hypothetical protein CEY16_11450 [Halalkalibacillus sediminis]
MDDLSVALKWLAQASIILGGVLSIYWFQYTDEGKNFWSTKIKNLNMEKLNENEQEVSPSKLRGIITVIKNGSLLLKVWLFLYSIFFASMIIMALIAVTT